METENRGLQLKKTSADLSVGGSEVNKPSELALRLVEVRVNARAHIQKASEVIDHLYGIKTSSGEAENPPGEITSEEVLSQYQSLAENTTLSDSEYILKSGLALTYGYQITHKLQKEEAELNRQIASCRFEVGGGHDSKIKELERGKGVKKISAVFKRRSLERKKAETQQKIDQLTAQVAEKKKLAEKIDEAGRPARKKQEDLIFTEVGKEVRAAILEYDHFFERVVEGGEIFSEIGELYIRETVTTAVTAMENNYRQKVLPNRKKEFFRTLRTSVKVSKTPEEELLTKDKLKGLFNDDFKGVEADCEPLFGNGSRDILLDLVGRLVAEDVRPFVSSAKGRIGNWYQREDFGREVNHALDVMDLGDAVIGELNRVSDLNFPDMRLWNAMKASRTANEIFGKEIEKKDKDFYNYIMDKSLSDLEGTYVRKLVFYPTPEAVRNLVILASADVVNYRTYHANKVIKNLSERIDWEKIIDQTEKAYPSIGDVKTLLRSWKVSDNYYYHVDGIQTATKQLALSLFENKSVDPRLELLATSALPNSALFKILLDKGLISADLMVISDVDTLLAKLDKQSDEQSQKEGSSSPYISSAAFKRAVRAQLFNILSQDISVSNDARLVLKNFKRLANVITANKDDWYVVDGLTSNELIKSFEDPSKRNEAALVFIQNFRLIENILSKDEVNVDDKNWEFLLMAYIRSHNEVSGLASFSSAEVDRVNSIFDDPKVRDLSLDRLTREWRQYLKSEDFNNFPDSLMLIPEFAKYCGSVGPLSQIESLCSLINSVDIAFMRITTAERTKGEILHGLAIMEDKFVRERWSNEERTDFYNISRDMLNAAPSIFSDCLSLFSNLTSRQLRQFGREIYPLYRTKLVLIEKSDKQGNKSYDNDQLIQLRHDIRRFNSELTGSEAPLEDEKNRLLGEIKDRFRDRFGIIKIPDNFTQEHVRSFTNVSMYLANMHERTPEKEAILGFYLSLMINDRWDEFRYSSDFSADEYLIPEKSRVVNSFIRERKRLNPLNSDNLGISEDMIPEFNRLLQQEVQNMTIGNIETIDVKLGNIIQNLHTLQDVDLYQDPLDKRRLNLLSNFGSKRVGSVVAKMYQGVVNPKKIVDFSGDDFDTQREILQVFQDLGLSFSPEALKQHFQDGMKPLSMVVNLLGFVKDTGAEEKIISLRRLLEPSGEVVEIFNRLGEEFKMNSGALALAQDLSYLDNLIVKREDELKPEEKDSLTEYVSRIRGEVVSLEAIYGQVKNKFGSLKQGTNISSNSLLVEKLAEIENIINAQSSQHTIVSAVNNNLNTVIENIRECLSCNRDGCNNDTNLTFGDSNKFYLYSRADAQDGGSISDELLFLEPVTKADGNVGLSFVMDRIYGTNTPDVLKNQISVVLKKYRILKQKFPDAKLSVFVSDVAISSGGMAPEMLIGQLHIENLSVSREFVEVNVVESAMGDHYIEFGGDVRTAGKRKVGGVLISG